MAKNWSALCYFYSEVIFFFFWFFFFILKIFFTFLCWFLIIDISIQMWKFQKNWISVTCWKSTSILPALILSAQFAQWMTVDNISWSNLHERMLPTRQGSNLQPPDHQSDVQPTEPPRPARWRYNRYIAVKPWLSNVDRIWNSGSEYMYLQQAVPESDPKTL